MKSGKPKPTSNDMRTEFQFRSKLFNITVPGDHFINPGCYGDDVAEWLIRRLNEAGVKTSAKPGQEDFGWYVTFVVDGVEYWGFVGFQPNDIASGDCWLGWIERRTGLLGSIFTGRRRNVLPEAVDVINSILTSSPEIHDLRWLPDGDVGA